MSIGRRSQICAVKMPKVSLLIGAFCASILVFVDIEVVTSMSLDRLSVDRNELVNNVPPLTPVIVEDNMRMEPVPSPDGVADMFVMLPAELINDNGSVDRNVIESTQQPPVDEDNSNDMLMVETNHEPLSIVMVAPPAATNLSVASQAQNHQMMEEASNGTQKLNEGSVADTSTSAGDMVSSLGSADEARQDASDEDGDDDEPLVDFIADAVDEFEKVVGLESELENITGDNVAAAAVSDPDALVEAIVESGANDAAENELVDENDDEDDDDDVVPSIETIVEEEIANSPLAAEVQQQEEQQEELDTAAELLEDLQSLDEDSLVDAIEDALGEEALVAAEEPQAQASEIVNNVVEVPAESENEIIATTSDDASFKEEMVPADTNIAETEIGAEAAVVTEAAQGTAEIAANEPEAVQTTESEDAPSQESNLEVRQPESIEETPIKLAPSYGESELQETGFKEEQNESTDHTELTDELASLEGELSTEQVPPQSSGVVLGEAEAPKLDSTIMNAPNEPEQSELSAQAPELEVTAEEETMQTDNEPSSNPAQLVEETPTVDLVEIPSESAEQTEKIDLPTYNVEEAIPISDEAEVLVESLPVASLSAESQPEEQAADPMQPHNDMIISNEAAGVAQEIQPLAQQEEESQSVDQSDSKPGDLDTVATAEQTALQDDSFKQDSQEIESENLNSDTLSEGQFESEQQLSEQQETIKTESAGASSSAELQESTELESPSLLTQIIQVPIKAETFMEPSEELVPPIQSPLDEASAVEESQEATDGQNILPPQIESLSQSAELSVEVSTEEALAMRDPVVNYVNATALSLPTIGNNNASSHSSLQGPEVAAMPEKEVEIFSPQSRRYDGAQLWRIVVQNDKDRRLADELQTKFDGQLWKEVRQEMDYLLKPQMLAAAAEHVRASNLSRIVLIDNLQQVIEVENPPAEEIAQFQNRKGHRLTWMAYHRLGDIHDFIDYMAKTYPDICSTEVIGYSIEKRPLKILKISNGNAQNPGIWIDGGMHAREWISPASVTYIANQLIEGWDDLPEYMRNINWYIHPVANPDGYEYSHTTDRLWRKNKRSHGRICPGVDLNRNFGYKWGGKGTSANPCSQTYRGTKAFSEPETFYISKFISNHPRDTFKAYLSFHSYGQYILYPWGYDYQLTADKDDLDLVARQAGSTITKSSGNKYTVGSAAITLYPAAGGSDDWAKGIAGIKYTYTIEMGDTGRYGFVLPASHIEPNGRDGFIFVQTIARAIVPTAESRKLRRRL